MRICRPDGIAREDNQKVLSYAIRQLGMPYNVRQILDLARLLFPWSILPRRWRSSLFVYNAGDATQQICSTLIAEAFASVKFPILPVIKRKDKNKVALYQFPVVSAPGRSDPTASSKARNKATRRKGSNGSIPDINQLITANHTDSRPFCDSITFNSIGF